MLRSITVTAGLDESRDAGMIHDVAMSFENAVADINAVVTESQGMAAGLHVLAAVGAARRSPRSTTSATKTGPSSSKSASRFRCSTACKRSSTSSGFGIPTGIADFTNGVIYSMRGMKSDATISFLCSVGPYVLDGLKLGACRSSAGSATTSCKAGLHVTDDFIG